MKLNPDLPVFQIAGQSFHLREILVGAHIWGDWERIIEKAREGLACLSLKEEIAEEYEIDSSIETTSEEYRYERNLVAAEEMESWLKARNMTVEDWMQYIEHIVLKNYVGDRLEEILPNFEADDEQIQSYAEVYAICSGDLMKLAGKLAKRLAFFQSIKEKRPQMISAAPGSQSTDQTENQIRQADFILERFKAENITAAVIEDEIHSHSMEWVQYTLQGIRFPEEPAASEALLCIREDGMSVSEVASDASAEMEEISMYFGEMAPAMQNQFFSAQEGELIGPYADQNGNYAVFQVIRKVLPDKSQPEIRKKAEQRFINRLMMQEMNNRVKWFREL